MQQHATTFMAAADAATRAELPQAVKDEVDTFLESWILAPDFLKLRCGDCGHEKLVAARVDDERHAGQSREQGAQRLVV